MSSRPVREERIRTRERERLQREQGYLFDLFQFSFSLLWLRSNVQYQNAEDALAEMEDEEEEEKEVEEVEDMLEYYMQRAAGVQSEAERVLAGFSLNNDLSSDCLSQALVIWKNQSASLCRLAVLR